MPGGALRFGRRWLRASLPPLVACRWRPLSRPPSRPPRRRSPLPLSPLPGVPPASPRAGVPPASSLGSVRAPVALAFGRPVGVRSFACGWLLRSGRSCPAHAMACAAGVPRPRLAPRLPYWYPLGKIAILGAMHSILFLALSATPSSRP